MALNMSSDPRSSKCSSDINFQVHCQFTLSMKFMQVCDIHEVISEIYFQVNDSVILHNAKCTGFCRVQSRKRQWCFKLLREFRISPHEASQCCAVCVAFVSPAVWRVSCLKCLDESRGSKLPDWGFAACMTYCQESRASLNRTSQDPRAKMYFPFVVLKPLKASWIFKSS